MINGKIFLILRGEIESCFCQKSHFLQIATETSSKELLMKISA
ncbi:uncharacterized protein CHAB577_0066 [Chlamydia abortus]|nr:uncharacterized protein CHAB577_0066 [Chlamydia abortus]